MFASIRRHQNWVWYVVLVVLIISFVVFFNPAAKTGMGSGPAPVDLGLINGRPITREEFGAAQTEATLDFFFQYGGHWPSEAGKSMGFNLDDATYQRVVLLEKLRQMKIEPGPDAAAEWIKEVFRPGKDQPFSMDFYNQFITRTMQPQGIDAERVQSFALHEVGRQQLIALYGLGGELVPPQEVEVIYRREFTPSVCDAVFFSVSNYLASVPAPEPAVSAFYTNNILDYSLPPRVRFDYVRFAGSNYLAEVDRQPEAAKAIAAQAEEVYAKDGPAHYQDGKGNPLPAEEAKAKIRSEVRANSALLFARRAANTFLSALLEKAPSDTNALRALAAAQHLQTGLSSVFDEKNGPLDPEPSPLLRRAAFSLSPIEPVLGTTVVTEDAVYVVSLNSRFPIESQPFAAVRDRALEDYKNTEALKMAHAAGEKFVAAATNGLAQGQLFAQVCAALKIVPVALPPFTPSAKSLPEIEDRVPLRDLQVVVFGLAPGKMSGFIRIPEGGMVVFLRAKLPVEEAKMKTELPAFSEQVRRRREYMCFNEWIFQERQQLGLKVRQTVQPSQTK
jgi:hypothetical protein